MASPMPSEVDAQIERARAAMERIADGYRDTPQRRRAQAAIGRRLVRIAVADGAILIAAFVIGLIVPLGILGATAVMALLIAATLLLALWPAEGRAPQPETLRTVEIKALPAQTGRWLEAQRPALPAPARTIADRIGQRLDTLAPQLATLDQGSDAAFEVRRLIGEQLPAFVNDYARVPAPLRSQARGGKTPDAELADGLALIDREIAAMTERLAQDDLDSLQTRGRFLEMKYRDDTTN